MIGCEVRAYLDRSSASRQWRGCQDHDIQAILYKLCTTRLWDQFSKELMSCNALEMGNVEAQLLGFNGKMS